MQRYRRRRVQPQLVLPASSPPPMTLLSPTPLTRFSSGGGASSLSRSRSSVSFEPRTASLASPSPSPSTPPQPQQPAGPRRARLVAITADRATLRCACGALVDLPPVALPVVSRAVVYVLAESENTVLDLEIGDAPPPVSETEAEVPGVAPAPANSTVRETLKRLKLMAGWDGDARDLRLDAALEADRHAHFAAYRALWQRNRFPEIWEQRFSELSSGVWIHFGAGVDAASRAALAVRNATFAARPVRGAPPAWCPAAVLSVYDEEAVRGIFMADAIEYNTETKSVRLALPRRRVRRNPDSAREFFDVLTGARITESFSSAAAASESGTVRWNTHDWCCDDDFPCRAGDAAAAAEAGVWMCCFALMRWRMLDDDAAAAADQKEIVVPRLAPRVHSVEGVSTAPLIVLVKRWASSSTAAGTGSSILRTSSKRGAQNVYAGPAPLFRPRGFRGSNAQPVPLSGLGATASHTTALPWTGAPAPELCGPPPAACDLVVYQWSPETRDCDVWRALLASRTGCMRVVGAPTVQRVREVFRTP